MHDVPKRFEPTAFAGSAVQRRPPRLNTSVVLPGDVTVKKSSERTCMPDAPRPSSALRVMGFNV